MKTEELYKLRVKMLKNQLESEREAHGITKKKLAKLKTILGDAMRRLNGVIDKAEQ